MCLIPLGHLSFFLFSCFIQLFLFFSFTDVNPSTICTILMLSFSLVLCLSCFLFRRYNLGGYDLRWEAIRWDLHQRYSRSAGEGRASPSAAHLHNRRLHGDGQMYVFLNRHKKGKQKNETDCILQFVRYSSNFLASIQRLKWKNVWMCSGCFGRANYFRCKQAKVISLQVAKKVFFIKVKGHFSFEVNKDIKIIRRNTFHPFLGAVIERQNNIFSHINRAHVYWKKN